MCRLFGLHAGAKPVTATFWLLDAPDSLQVQSHREPDGAGIGFFDPSGNPVVDKQPLAAWRDAEFAREARTARSSTFVAHVRYASTGAHTVANTHPFIQDGRLFAHNGAFSGLDLIDERLAGLGAADLVGGQTDSERMFALITAEARRRGLRSDAADSAREFGEAITAAVSWIADALPVFALNMILATPDELWALRYPATHELYVLDRRRSPHQLRSASHSRTDPAPAAEGARLVPGGRLDVSSQRISTRSDELSGAPAVIIASEPMEGETGWRLMDPGELVRIGTDLTITSSQPFPAAPRRQLTLADLSPTAAASQEPGAQHSR